MSNTLGYHVCLADKTGISGQKKALPGGALLVGIPSLSGLLPSCPGLSVAAFFAMSDRTDYHPDHIRNLPYIYLLYIINRENNKFLHGKKGRIMPEIFFRAKLATNLDRGWLFFVSHAQP